jgi:hypothetical protein
MIKRPDSSGLEAKADQAHSDHTIAKPLITKDLTDARGIRE